jgi:hypothetical protein
MSIRMPGRPAWTIFLLVAAFVVAGACSRGEPQGSISAIALINDPVALDNALARCNQRSASIEDPECRSVRLALVRLADERRKKSGDDERRKQREAEIKFEQQREALRQRHEGQREEPKPPKVTDPYTMPFVPPESPGSPKSDSNTQPQA